MLAISPVASFAQSDDALYERMKTEYDNGDYRKAAISADQYLQLAIIKPQNEMIALSVRGNSMMNIIFYEVMPQSVDDYTFTFTEKQHHFLANAIQDIAKVVDYYKANTNSTEGREIIATDQRSIATLYLFIGKYRTHLPIHFAKAEEFFKLALPNSKNKQRINSHLVTSLAGQYRFDEARALAKQVLNEESEEDFEPTLDRTVEAFDMMGQYVYTDALLFEIAEIRRKNNKSLAPFAKIEKYRAAAQKAVLEGKEYHSPMEFNRAAALYARNKQCDKAMPLIESGRQKDDTFTANELILVCQIEQKQYDAAMKTADYLIEYYKTKALAYSYRGWLNANRNDGVKAEADFNAAFKIFPELAAMSNGFNNGKEIYRIQNNLQKQNEIAALEKKYADIKTEIARAGEIAAKVKPPSAEELVAKQNAAAANAKAEQLQSDYKVLINRLDNLTNQMTRWLFKYKELIGTDPQFAADSRKRLDKLSAEGNEAIKEFANKYGNMITASMVAGIKEHWKEIVLPK